LAKNLLFTLFAAMLVAFLNFSYVYIILAQVTK
jgi:hypothetical protein